MQSAAAVMLMPLLIFFAAYTAAVTRNTFQWDGKLQKLPHPLRGSRPPI